MSVFASDVLYCVDTNLASSRLKAVLRAGRGEAARAPLIDTTMYEILCAQRHLKRPRRKNVTQRILKYNLLILL
jgi:hypothetical protein